MRINIEMRRLLCLKAADMMDKAGNKSAPLEIAMIKVAAPRMALKIIDDAIHAHGAAGVTTERAPNTPITAKPSRGSARRRGIAGSSRQTVRPLFLAMQTSAFGLAGDEKNGAGRQAATKRIGRSALAFPSPRRGRN